MRIGRKEVESYLLLVVFTSLDYLQTLLRDAAWRIILLIKSISVSSKCLRIGTVAKNRVRLGLTAPDLAPTYFLGWIAAYDAVVRHVLGNHCTCNRYCASAYCNPRINENTRSYPRTFLYDYGPILIGHGRATYVMAGGC
jgi:hypothetical protein